MEPININNSSLSLLFGAKNKPTKEKLSITLIIVNVIN